MSLDFSGRSFFLLGLLVAAGCSSSSSVATAPDAGGDADAAVVFVKYDAGGPIHVDGGHPAGGCDDNAKDGNETDVDCGGSCSPCADGDSCAKAADCESGVCTAAVCQEALPPMQCTVASDCTPSSNVCSPAACVSGECVDQPASSGTACSASGGTSCDGMGNCVSACQTVSDCAAPTTSCKTDTCVSSVCGTSNATLGTACTDNGGKTCDGAGTCVGCNKAADCPVPTTLCKVAACTGNGCGVTNATSGTTCTDNGGTVCDGNGSCVVGCTTASDCPRSTTTCAAPACTNNFCASTNAPAETVCTDNNGAVCDGAGSCVACDVAGDCPAQTSTCLVNTCTAHVCGTKPAAKETACTGLGTVCDGSGTCVACNTATDCTGTLMDCEVHTCTANVCGTGPAPEETACTTGGKVCNTLGVCVACNTTADCTSPSTCTAGACL